MANSNNSNSGNKSNNSNNSKNSNNSNDSNDSSNSNNSYNRAKILGLGLSRSQIHLVAEFISPKKCTLLGSIIL